MYEIILDSLALPQYTKISCKNKECSYILIVLLEVLCWQFEKTWRSCEIMIEKTTKI